MEEITVSSKGQVVIPKYLRESLDLKEGAKLVMFVHDGKLVMMKKPQDPLESLSKAGQSLNMKNIRRDIKPE